MSRFRPRRTWPLTAIMLIGAVWTGLIIFLYPLTARYQLHLFHEAPARTTILGLAEGQAMVFSYTHTVIDGAPTGWRQETLARQDAPTIFKGIRWWFDTLQRPGGAAYFAPLWTFALPALIATALAWRRRTVIRRGSCPKCGHDTRGLTHAACPKCGRTLAV